MEAHGHYKRVLHLSVLHPPMEIIFTVSLCFISFWFSVTAKRSWNKGYSRFTLRTGKSAISKEKDKQPNNKTPALHNSHPKLYRSHPYSVQPLSKSAIIESWTSLGWKGCVHAFTFQVSSVQHSPWHPRFARKRLQCPTGWWNRAGWNNKKLMKHVQNASKITNLTHN